MSGDTYHHGNLRRALLDAAWTLVGTDGVDALSLRAIARVAGVSHAAPAHHFKDKAGLVEALAIEGHERFERALTQAEDAASTPADRLVEIGVAYVRFAQQFPDAFRLMNRPELRGGSDSPAVRAAALACGDVLLRALTAAHAAPVDDLENRALLAWSGVHGLATLAIDGLLDFPPDDLAAGERATRAVLDVMGAGLLTDEG